MPVPGGLDERSAVRLAVLVSGEGTLLEALAARASSGRLSARIVLVLSDRPGVPALSRAQRAGIETEVVAKAGTPPSEWAERLSDRLGARATELVLLDGFLSVLPGPFVAGWRGRILNIHPSLLPRHGGPGLYGRRVHEAVLRAHDAETGVTVHEVTEAIDAGPIRVQRRLAVRPSDTPDSLRERLRPLEIEALTEAIDAWRAPDPAY